MTSTACFDPISMKSVTEIIGHSKQVLVYGTVGCGWEWIQSQLLTRPDSPVERVFNYVIGDDIPGHDEFIPEGAITTLEGRVFAKVSSGAKDATGPRGVCIPIRTKRICKAALVNWGFEVWRRREMAAKIPLIFAIDKGENEYPLSIEDILSKTKAVRGKKVNDVTTFSEIRRLASLCNDERIDQEFRAEIQKHIAFVRLEKVGKEFVLVKISEPWKHSAWNTELAKRKKLSVKVEKSYDWRIELNALISEERSKKTASAAEQSMSLTPTAGGVDSQSKTSYISQFSLGAGAGVKRSTALVEAEAEKAESKLMQGILGEFFKKS